MSATAAARKRKLETSASGGERGQSAPDLMHWAKQFLQDLEARGQISLAEGQSRLEAVEEALGTFDSKLRQQARKIAEELQRRFRGLPLSRWREWWGEEKVVRRPNAELEHAEAELERIAQSVFSSVLKEKEFVTQEGTQEGTQEERDSPEPGAEGKTKQRLNDQERQFLGAFFRQLEGQDWFQKLGLSERWEVLSQWLEEQDLSPRQQYLWRQSLRTRLYLSAARELQRRWQKTRQKAQRAQRIIRRVKQVFIVSLLAFNSASTPLFGGGEIISPPPLVLVQEEEQGGEEAMSLVRPSATSSGRERPLVTALPPTSLPSPDATPTPPAPLVSQEPTLAVRRAGKEKRPAREETGGPALAATQVPTPKREEEGGGALAQEAAEAWPFVHLAEGKELNIAIVNRQISLPPLKIVPWKEMEQQILRGPVNEFYTVGSLFYDDIPLAERQQGRGLLVLLAIHSGRWAGETLPGTILWQNLQEGDQIRIESEGKSVVLEFVGRTEESIPVADLVDESDYLSSEEIEKAIAAAGQDPGLEEGINVVVMMICDTAIRDRASKTFPNRYLMVFRVVGEEK